MKWYQYLKIRPLRGYGCWTSSVRKFSSFYKNRNSLLNAIILQPRLFIRVFFDFIIQLKNQQNGYLLTKPIINIYVNIKINMKIIYYHQTKLVTPILYSIFLITKLNSLRVIIVILAGTRKLSVNRSKRRNLMKHSENYCVFLMQLCK